MTNISKEEWKFVYIFSAIVVLLTLSPVIYNYLTEPDGYQFMGIVTNPGDSNTYFDYMNQAAKGKLTFINSYTHEDMKPLLVRPLWRYMGLFTTFLPSILVWHLFRVILGFLLLTTFYFYSSKYISSPTDRKLTLALFSLTSGFGYYMLQVNKFFGTSLLPIDLGITEAIPFLSLNGAPHFIVSFILIILIMYLFEKHIANNTSQIIFASILTLFIGFIHVYDLVTIFLVTGIYVLYLLYKKFDWKLVKRAFIFYLIGSLSGIYYFIVFTFDPIFSNWTSQNILESPQFHALALGLGPWFILGLAGSLYFIYKKNASYLFISLWLLINTIILYLPVSFQIRFLEGIFVPSILVGFLFFKELLKFLPLLKKYYHLIVIVILFIFTATNFLVFSSYFDLKTTDSKYSGKYYLSDDELDAVSWISKNTFDQDVILADPLLSNYIPRLTGNKVYVGHWAQTINHEAKLRNYYENTYNLENIDYIINKNYTITQVKER